MKENVKKSEKQDNHPNRLMERPSSSRHGVTLKGRHDRGSHTRPGGGSRQEPRRRQSYKFLWKNDDFPKTAISALGGTTTLLRKDSC